MLAVALMTIIMLGLLAMFYQTQRAMRVGTAQVDVMGTGDAAMRLIADELKQVVAAGENARLAGTTNYIPHLETRTPYLPLFWTRNFGSAQATYLQDLFFIRRENDKWIGTGYFVDPVTDQGGAGVLYRFEWIERTSQSNALVIIYNEFQKAKTTTVPRLADRIAHLQVHAFNADGEPLFGNPFPNLTFTNSWLPAYLDVELAVLEPKPYDRFRARYDSNNVNTAFALAYLTNQLDRLHIFRQRIPIRTVQ